MKVLFSIFCLIIGMNAFAECGNAYKEKIKAIEGRLNPPRTTVISNIIAEGAVVGVLAAAGTIPVTAVVALPAAAVGAGAYFGYLIVERNGYRDGMHVIAEAHKGKGVTLKKFMKKLKRKMKEDVDEDEVINLLRQGDFDNTFCVFNEVKDTYKLMSFRKLLRYTKKQLSGVDDASLETDNSLVEAN